MNVAIEYFILNWDVAAELVRESRKRRYNKAANSRGSVCSLAETGSPIDLCLDLVTPEVIRKPKAVLKEFGHNLVEDET